MKKAAAICMTLVMAVSLSAEFTSLADDQTALERVLEKGKLVVATDAAWPPFEYMEGENVVGVDLDIAKDKDVKLITDPEADVAGVAAVHNDVPETDEEEAAAE